MHVLQRARNIPAHYLFLNTLHVFNDGYLASFMLLLPFIASAQHINLAQVGVLGAALNVATILVALPSGAIARKLGSMRALVLGMLVYAIALLGVGMYGNYIWMMAMFVLGGLSFGLFHPIGLSLISKWSTKENRGRMMGDFTAIGDIGRIGIAAALSFLVVYLGFRSTVFLYAGVALVFGVILVAYLRKNHERITAAAGEQQPVAKMSLWQIFKNRRYIFAISATTLDEFVSETLYIFLPFLLLARGISPALVGTFAAAYFVGNILGKTVLGRLSDRTGRAQVFIVAELLMAAFVFLLANSTSVIPIIICSVVLGVLTKGTIPVLKAMLAESVEHHGNYEKAFALESMIGRAAKTIAPIVLGFTANSFGVVTAFIVMSVVGLLAVIPGVLYYLSKPPQAVAPTAPS